MAITIKITSHKPLTVLEKNIKCHKALEECAMLAESETKIRCPVDTGNLRRSYTHRSDEKEMVVGTDVEYGKYQELGTSRSYPQPHLRPSFENNTDRFKATVERELRT